MRSPGKLIVFEGADGVGKTTLARSTSTAIVDAGIPCEYMAFPGHVPGTLGQLVYRIHHCDPGTGVQAVDPTAMQLMHVAAHIDCIEKHVKPAIARGIWVVLDRYWWSTWVYGLATNANRRSLRAALRAESEHWGRMVPEAIFLLQSDTPHRGSPTPEWRHLCVGYDKLATQQADRMRIVRLVAHDDASSLTRIVVGQLLHDGTDNRQRSNAVPQAPYAYAKSPAVKPTPVYDTYFRFATQRQAIFHKRVRGEAPPWTTDPILSTYKFTNAYRASDRVSQYLIRHVIYDGAYPPRDLFFRILLFKLFNRIDTWELIRRRHGEITYRDFNFRSYDVTLTKAIESGDRIYSAAYIMPTGGVGRSDGRKHRMHLRLLDQMMKDDMPSRVADCPDMATAFRLLRSYPTIGDFLAYQYVTDLNYSPLTNFEETEFVMAGPGARDGVRKCFSDMGNFDENSIIRMVAERQADEFRRLGLQFRDLWGRSLKLIDCQNLFCEVDKYARVCHPEYSGLSGRTRIKQRFTWDPTPIQYWYPPKWNINEAVEKDQHVQPFLWSDRR